VKVEPQPDEAPVSAPPAPAPQRVYTTPPRSFQVVSQHDEAAEEAHRPNRKRRDPGSPLAAAEPALQLVETQAEPQPAVMEDELPRRTKPRRRRSSQSEGGPLQLVETQPTAEGSGTDSAPTA